MNKLKAPKPKTLKMLFRLYKYLVLIDMNTSCASLDTIPSFEPLHCSGKNLPTFTSKENGLDSGFSSGSDDEQVPKVSVLKTKRPIRSFEIPPSTDSHDKKKLKSRFQVLKHSIAIARNLYALTPILITLYFREFKISDYFTAFFFLSVISLCVLSQLFRWFERPLAFFFPLYATVCFCQILLTCIPSFLRGRLFSFIGSIIRFGLKFFDMISGNFEDSYVDEPFFKIASVKRNFLIYYMPFLSSCITFSLIILFFVTFFYVRRHLRIRRSCMHSVCLLIISSCFVFSGGFGDFIEASVIHWKNDFISRVFGNVFLTFLPIVNSMVTLFLYLILDKIYSWMMFFFESSFPSERKNQEGNLELITSLNKK